MNFFNIATLRLNVKNQIAGLALMMLLLFTACNKDGGTYYKYESLSETYDGNALQYLESQKGVFDSLVVVLKRYPEVMNLLTSEDSITLFAIPNSAFQLAVSNFNVYRASIDSPLLYLSKANLDLTRADSGLVNYELLNVLISRYIFKGYYDFNTLAKSINGNAIPSIQYNYKMNLKAMQENSFGSISDGPKVIELSDMNYSYLTTAWKSTNTSAVNTVKAKNVIIHSISSKHEFGFASFTNYLNEPKVLRDEWVPMAWHSQQPDQITGGTVYHVMDGDLNTSWSSKKTGDIIAPPYWFTMDMNRTYKVSGIAIQNQTEWTSFPGKVTEFILEFAKDGANLDDPSSWVKSDTFRIKNPSMDNISLYYKFDLKEQINCRYFKFTGLRNYNGFATTRYCDLAEIWLY